uniref:Uncharacterized protein n=1 Tax=Maylandia zebra TaxID=106582 RepID=A0A3P9DJP4_9CICH
MNKKGSEKTRHVVAWLNKAEWDQVRDYLYSMDSSLQRFALERISAWRARCANSFPVAVDCTADLVRCQVRDRSGQLTGDDLTLMYGTALVRFVNLITDQNCTHPTIHTSSRLHKTVNAQAEIFLHLSCISPSCREFLKRRKLLQDVTIPPPVEEPPRRLDAPAAPCSRAGPPCTHPPTTPAAHQPGPKPRGPARAPAQRRGRQTSETCFGQKRDPRYTCL